MNKIKLTIISLSSFVMLTVYTVACTQETKVEKNVEVNPGDSVTQQTTVDKEVTTGVKDSDVTVDTKVDTNH